MRRRRVAKKLVLIRRKEGAEGKPTQHSYVYEVDGREVSIEVLAMVLHRWNVIEPDIEKAIEILIDTRMNEGWSPAKSNHLHLDELTATPIAEKLGWRPLRR
jgi:hypothetical protein